MNWWGISFVLIIVGVPVSLLGLAVLITEPKRDRSRPVPPAVDQAAGQIVVKRAPRFYDWANDENSHQLTRCSHGYVGGCPYDRP